MLPTRRNLLRWQVLCENHCPMCVRATWRMSDMFSSTVINVEVVWETCGLLDDVTKEMTATESFTEGLFKLLQSVTETKVAKLAMMVWAISGRYNEKVWSGTLQSVNSVVSKALDFLSEWKRAKSSTHGTVVLSNQQQQDHQWQKPNVGQLKCNLDAALFTTENQFGLGMCIRDHLGEFRKGNTMWFHGTSAPQEAEAMGLKHALWLVELGLTSVSIELDCLLVVNGVKNGLRSSFEFLVLLFIIIDVYFQDFKAFKLVSFGDKLILLLTRLQGHQDYMLALCVLI